MAFDNSTIATAGTNATALEYNSVRGDIQSGWIKPHIKTGSVYVLDTWAYSSVSGEYGVVTIASDGTERYEVGDKVRFKQGGGYKYFVISAVSSTSLTITGGSEYSLANAAITDLYISTMTSPIDWPLGKNVLISETDGATVTFNLDASMLQQVTLGGNRTLAITNARKGDIFALRLIQDGGGSRTVTWFSTITWRTSGGTAPTLAASAGAVTTVMFICTGSGTYDGFLVGKG